MTLGGFQAKMNERGISPDTQRFPVSLSECAIL